MTNKDEQRHIKSIKMLQQRAETIEGVHDEIHSDITDIRAKLAEIGDVDNSTESFAQIKQTYLCSMSLHKELSNVDMEDIFSESESVFPDNLRLDDILTPTDWAITDKRITARVDDFNRQYALDGWDYAIAGGCGLFAAMLDLLCVSAPAKPTTNWTKKIDGVFNRGVQQAFNRLLPPDVSEVLGRLNTIGSADVSTTGRLKGAPLRTLNPANHRLRSLSHDPILGFLFGVLDMSRGTCTVVGPTGLKPFPTTSESIVDGLFPRLGRMFGHLLSDVNAPSSKGNRGMGLPAPFMGLLRMIGSRLRIGESDIGKQIEFMYVNGYDFRHLIVTSVPLLIMEVMMRAFYGAKQSCVAGVPLGEALIETMPMRMNPRFRMMLAIAYGTVAAVNGGKAYITQNVLNLNYAAWIGLVWNGFFSLKWVLLNRSIMLWDGIERAEIEAIEDIIAQIDGMVDQARKLPTGD